MDRYSYKLEPNDLVYRLSSRGPWIESGLAPLEFRYLCAKFILKFSVSFSFKANSVCENCTHRHSSLMMCVSFPIRNGPAWELHPKPDHNESSGTYMNDVDDNDNDDLFQQKLPA